MNQVNKLPKARPTINFVTSNRGKFNEVKAILSRHGINVKMIPISLPELQGKRLEEVIVHKARQAFERAGGNKPVVVDDSGIFLAKANGFPGVHTQPVYDQIGLDGIFRVVPGTKPIEAVFQTAVAMIGPGDSKPTIFTGECRGNLLRHPTPGKFDPHLPFNPYFVPAGQRHSYAQMTEEQRNSLSHRGKAFDAFAKWFNRQGAKGK